jgi:NAD(P)-dependent dehydrogenase (short-subunit alcohol dehydrogenase family)
MGHRVVGCGRRAGRIREMGAALGGDHIFGVCDTADESSVAQWSATVLQQLGSAPDVLINNAGVSGDGAQGMPLWEVPKETWDSVMDVNVHGILNMMRYIVPAMVEAGSGLIVNVSSGTGHSTFDSTGNGVYSTSKWCVESISKCVAMTLPEPLICVPFAPGVVRTEMTDADVPDATEWAVLAAPFILNLGDCPAQEDFNGTSVVGRIFLEMMSVQCTIRTQLIVLTDSSHPWPGDAGVLSTGLHGGMVDSAKSPLAVRPPFLHSLAGTISCPALKEDDCVWTNSS